MLIIMILILIAFSITMTTLWVIADNKYKAERKRAGELEARCNILEVRNKRLIDWGYKVDSLLNKIETI